MDRNQTQLTTQGFTVKSRMKNYVVVGPSDAGAFQERAAKSAKFRKFFDRGDFPIALKHGLINSIAWRQEIETLDYNHYLPLFFDGLVETAHPYKFFACQGIHDMLQHAGPWIVPIVPQLIMPIKKALNTRNHQVMLNTLKALQQLMTCTDGVGKALVPFFKHILPVLNIFKNKKLTTGDAIDYSQQKRDIIGDVIEETLQLFERYGGEDAFESIRSMVPTYTSCMGDPLKSDIQRMQIELPSEESHITQHTTQHKPARVPPLCRRAGNLFKAKYPLITRTLLSGTEKHCYDSKANKQYLESIKHWTCLPPITKANQASYPSTVTDESSARYSTERPQSTKQYMEITRPLTCLPPISKTKQPNYPSKVTDMSSPRHGTERPQSTRQDMGITRPKTRLPSISKTSQSDCPSKVTGDSSLRCGTARPKSTRQVLQRTKPQPGYQVNIQVDLRKTCLPPIQPK